MAATTATAAMKMQMKMARPLPEFLVDPPLTWREEGMPIRPAGDGETVMRPGPREWKLEAFFAAACASRRRVQHGWALRSVGRAFTVEHELCILRQLSTLIRIRAMLAARGKDAKKKP